jgi:hypothetical protein
MLYNNLHFFSSKCRLFHNATFFGFCITHILNTVCAKIWKKKIRRQKVNTSFGFYGFPACLHENVGINKLGLADHFDIFSVHASLVIIFNAI